MVETLKTVLGTLLLLFQSRSRLQVEILVLRHQLIVLRRTAPKRARLNAGDRLLFVLLYRLWPGVLDSIAVVKPDAIVRLHRRGVRALWRWKSRRRLGRPGIAKDMRDLIREISRANPLWGAPRIHGELLKLGIDVAQSTVAKYAQIAARLCRVLHGFARTCPWARMPRWADPCRAMGCCVGCLILAASTIHSCGCSYWQGQVVK